MNSEIDVEKDVTGLSRALTEVLILDGNSEKGAHARDNLWLFDLFQDIWLNQEQSLKRAQHVLIFRLI